MKLFKEKAGVISELSVWVLFYGGSYMIAHESLLTVIFLYFKEGKIDSNLIG